jgi:hypothetical protein
LAITYPRRSRSFILRENDAVLLFLPLFLLAAQAQDDFYLKNGDSITAQRLYTNFVESYVVTRFPKLNVRFVESGWPGDRVDGGLAGSIDQRLARDVVAYRNTFENARAARAAGCVVEEETQRRNRDSGALNGLEDAGQRFRK